MSNHTSLSGSQIRAMKRELNPKAFTRAQATRLIASTSDADLIGIFLGHGNKHVRKYAFRNSQGGAEVGSILSKVIQLVFLPWAEAPMAIAAPKVNPWAMLAEAYGEDPAFVAELAKSKGEDAASVKRSLISRKSARSRAAKAQSAS